MAAEVGSFAACEYAAFVRSRDPATMSGDKILDAGFTPPLDAAPGYKVVMTLP